MTSSVDAVCGELNLWMSSLRTLVSFVPSGKVVTVTFLVAIVSAQPANSTLAVTARMILIVFMISRAPFYFLSNSFKIAFVLSVFVSPGRYWETDFSSVMVCLLSGPVFTVMACITVVLLHPQSSALAASTGSSSLILIRSLCCGRSPAGLIPDTTTRGGPAQARTRPVAALVALGSTGRKGKPEAWIPVHLPKCRLEWHNFWLDWLLKSRTVLAYATIFVQGPTPVR